jgi:hypothetical protein
LRQIGEELHAIIKNVILEEVASAKQQQVGFNSATNVMIQFLQNIAAV